MRLSDHATARLALGVILLGATLFPATLSAAEAMDSTERQLQRCLDDVEDASTAGQACTRFFERALAAQAGMRIDRSAMTSSPTLGQIWRADAVSVKAPVRASRFTCTKDSKSIEPLGAPDAE